MEKRAFIKSYGCQMNVYDATRMADQLRASGYDVVDEQEGADLVVLDLNLRTWTALPFCAPWPGARTWNLRRARGWGR